MLAPTTYAQAHMWVNKNTPSQVGTLPDHLPIA